MTHQVQQAGPQLIVLDYTGWGVTGSNVMLLPSQTLPPSDVPSSSSSGLSSGAVAGIVVGSVVGAALLMLVVTAVLLKRRCGG